MTILCSAPFLERISRQIGWALLGLTLILGCGVGVRAQDLGEDIVVATVNGTPIHYSDLALAEEEYSVAFASIPEEERFRYLLPLMIERLVMADAARKLNLQDDPAVLRREAYYKEKILRDVYWEREITSRITDEALQELYESEFANLELEEEMRARHILVNSEEEAQQIIADLEAGADFEELAQERSTGPSGPDGGDLGYFTKGRMVPQFSEAAFALQPGEISAPVKTQFGWHVIKVEDRRIPEPPTFEESRAELTSLLVEQESEKLVEKLQSEADIVIVGTQRPRPEIVPE